MRRQLGKSVKERSFEVKSFLKSTVSFVLVLALIFSFAACSSESGNSESESSTNDSSASGDVYKRQGQHGQVVFIGRACWPNRPSDPAYQKEIKSITF